MADQNFGLSIGSAKAGTKTNTKASFDRFAGDFGVGPGANFRSKFLPPSTGPKSFSVNDLQNFFAARPGDPQAAAFRNAVQDSDVETIRRIAQNLNFQGQSGTGDVFSPAQQIRDIITSLAERGLPGVVDSGTKAINTLANNNVQAFGSNAARAETPGLLNADLLNIKRTESTPTGSKTKVFNDLLDRILDPSSVDVGQAGRNLLDQTAQQTGGRAAVSGLGAPGLGTLVQQNAPVLAGLQQQGIQNRANLFGQLLDESGQQVQENVAEIGAQIQQLVNEQNRLTELSITNAKFLDAQQARDLNARISAVDQDIRRLTAAGQLAQGRQTTALDSLSNLVAPASSISRQVGQQSTSSAKKSSFGAAFGI